MRWRAPCLPAERDPCYRKVIIWAVSSRRGEGALWLAGGYPQPSPPPLPPSAAAAAAQAIIINSRPV